MQVSTSVSCAAGLGTPIQASGQPILQKLTSGLTIQTATGKWRWRQLFIADDASAILAQGADSGGFPTLWLWIRSAHQTNADGKVNFFLDTFP